jgi:alpha-glucosidase
MWNWEADKELYPDLEKKIAEWKAQGIRFLGYINPFLAIEKDLYKEASAKGYCVKDKEGKDYLVTITTFPAAMVDFTNPEACEWYKGIIKKNMIGIGMGGWMADFGEYLPMDCVLSNGESPELWHNRWPAVWAKLNREAVKESGAEGDVFFFTRAGNTGTVAESDMMWTGDQHVDWSVDDGLPSVIPATLSLAMSGFGLTHSDVGGYTTIMKMRRSKELLMRWEEMNVFSPLYRSHEGNQPVNNVQFDADDELLAQLSRTSRMHAALAPYLKKLVKLNAEKGTPVMRPLFYHYDEPEAYTETTEYLLGRDVLVAPVIKQGAVSRTVYLPNDHWVEIFTGRQLFGGTQEIEAPIGKPPVFVRKDSPDYDLLMQIGRME